MAVTVSSSAVIRTPDEDANYDSNCYYHWKCDELSGGIADYGPAGPTRHLTLGNSYGVLSYNQAMITGLTGIHFSGGATKYSSSAVAEDFGHPSGGVVNESTVEMFIVHKGNPSLTGSNVYMGEILNVCGNAGQSTVFPRQVRSKGTNAFGVKWGHQYSNSYHSGPGTSWDNTSFLDFGGGTTNVFHIAFLYKKGTEGVGYTKVFIDNSEKSYTAVYGSGTTHDYYNAGLQASASYSPRHIMLGGRNATAVGINAIVAHVAVWDTLITDFSSVSPPAGPSGGVIRHHYDKNICHKDDKCGLVKPTDREVIQLWRDKNGLQ